MTWWKIVCLDCGVNCDLLMDKDQRVICRTCLEIHDFKEGNQHGQEDQDQEGYELGRAVLSSEIKERINPKSSGKEIKGQLLDPGGHRTRSQKKPKHELRGEGFELPENRDAKNI